MPLHLTLHSHSTCGIYYRLHVACLHFHQTTLAIFQYIRVMAEGAQCAEDGPFFPTTPRYVIQSGMGLDRNILISPDWLYIGLMLGCFFLLLILLALALVSFLLRQPQSILFMPGACSNIQPHN